MTPKLDGSHDKLPPDYHKQENPKARELMEDVLEPLMAELVKDGGVEALDKMLIELAEEVEDDLRINDPESPMVADLDEHRLKTRGFD